MSCSTQKPGKILEEKLNNLFYQLYQLYHKERESKLLHLITVTGIRIISKVQEGQPMSREVSHEEFSRTVTYQF